LEVKANRVGDPRHQWQGFAQQRRFIAIARRRNKRRDHIAITIAEGDDLVAFHLLVTAETNVVAAFFAAVVVPSPWMTVCREDWLDAASTQSRQRRPQNSHPLATFEMRHKCACNEFLGGLLDLSRSAIFSTDTPGKAIVECS